MAVDWFANSAENAFALARARPRRSRWRALESSLGAIGRAARAGGTVKGGLYLEQLGVASELAFILNSARLLPQRSGGLA